MRALCLQSWHYVGQWHKNNFIVCISAATASCFVNCFQLYDLDLNAWREIQIRGLKYTRHRIFFHVDAAGDFAVVHVPSGDAIAAPVHCYRIPLRHVKLFTYKINKKFLLFALFF